MQTNYYEMQLALRKYKYQLIKTIDIKEVEFLILEIKSYIFSKEELRTEFIEKLTNLENLIETKDYKEKSQQTYENVKIFTKQLAQKNNRKMYYSKNKKWCAAEQFAYIRSYNNKYDNIITGDYPLLYLYNSVLLPTMIFNSDEALTKNGLLTNIKISSSLKVFYNQYNYGYNNIIEIPQNLEFLIACADIEISSIYSSQAIYPFNMVYVATSLFKVLDILDSYLNNKIPSFFKLPENTIKTEREKHKLKYFSSSKTFKIDNYNFKLTPAEVECLEQICKGTITPKRKQSSYVTKINNKAKELIGIKIINSQNKKPYQIIDKYVTYIEY